MPRFIREHTNFGEVVPYSRWWLNRPYKSWRKRFPRLSITPWLIRTKIIRLFQPRLISGEIGNILPMEAPSSIIFSVKREYAERDAIRQDIVIRTASETGQSVEEVDNVLKNLTQEVKENLDKFMNNG